MNQSTGQPLIAVDIGNSVMKLGLFEVLAPVDELPQPLEVIETDSLDAALAPLERLPHPRYRWRLASVQRQSQQRLVDWVARHRPDDELRILSRHDLPLILEVEEPDGVGVDRLVAAVAANHVRPEGRAAIIVDTGTAVTVDAVSPQGVFLGGAILPGVSMVSRALHEEADLLPSVHFTEDHDQPPVLGKSTVAAIRSGLFWGVVGAVRELVDRISTEFEQPPEVLITGGYAQKLSAQLKCKARYLSHLVLGGIALTALNEADPP